MQWRGGVRVDVSRTTRAIVISFIRDDGVFARLPRLERFWKELVAKGVARHRLESIDDNGESSHIYLSPQAGPELVKVGVVDVDLSDKALGLDGRVRNRNTPRFPGKPTDLSRTITRSTPELAHFMSSSEMETKYVGYDFIHEITAREIKKLGYSYVDFSEHRVVYFLSSPSATDSRVLGRFNIQHVHPLYFNSKTFIHESTLKLIRESTKRYTLVEMVLSVNTFVGFMHANLLIFDHHLKIVSRFEPHGADTGAFKASDFDGLENELKLRFPEYVYAGPSYISGNSEGPQKLTRDIQVKLLTERGGYCAAWTSLFAMILANFNFTVHQAHAFLGTDVEVLSEVIRCYGAWLARESEIILNEQRERMETLRDQRDREMRWYRKKFGTRMYEPCHSRIVMEEFFPDTRPAWGDKEKEFIKMAEQRIEARDKYNDDLDRGIVDIDDPVPYPKEVLDYFGIDPFTYV